MGWGGGEANFHSIKNYQKTIANTFWGNYQNKVVSKKKDSFLQGKIWDVSKNGEQSINTQVNLSNLWLQIMKSSISLDIK